MPGRKFSTTMSASVSELAHDVLALRRLEIQRDGLLVARLREPPERRALVQMPPAPQRIAAVRGLDLDDLGTELREDPPAERPGDEGAHLEHLHAGERLLRVGHAWNSRRTRPGIGVPGHEAVAVGDLHAVDPDAVHARRGRDEPRRAGRQIVDAIRGAATDGVRIEQEEVGVRTSHETGRGSGMPGERRRPRPSCGGSRVQWHQLAVADPVTEDVQREARVAEELEVGADRTA